MTFQIKVKKGVWRGKKDTYIERETQGRKGEIERAKKKFKREKGEGRDAQRHAVGLGTPAS